MLMVYIDGFYSLSLLEAVVAGYITKDCSIDEMIRAIKVM
jgi:DNA-binding NarL/FixJ family response regulator